MIFIRDIDNLIRAMMHKKIKNKKEGIDLTDYTGSVVSNPSDY